MTAEIDMVGMMIKSTLLMSKRSWTYMHVDLCIQHLADTRCSKPCRSYGKPFYYLLCKIDILYIISDI